MLLFYVFSIVLFIRNMTTNTDLKLIHIGFFIPSVFVDFHQVFNSDILPVYGTVISVKFTNH